MDKIKPMFLKPLLKNKKDNKNIQVKASSLEDVFFKCNIDKAVWEVDDYSVKELSGGDFLWSVYFKQKKGKFDLDEIRKDLQSLSKLEQKRDYAYKDSDLLLECSFPDVHLSKLTWELESGHNYDLKIAAANLRKGVARTIDLSKKFEIAQILLPIGNDYYQSDTINNATTLGTPVSVDTRHHKMFRDGYKLMIEIIEQLKDIAPVHIISCPGNHDHACSLYMSEVLDCYYHNDENVTVDTSVIVRKYYRWGKNLIGFTHGNKERMNDLAVLMATEASKDWAQTKYRVWHLGHFHTRRALVDEKCGVLIEVLPSLSGTDSWHFEKGYTGNIRGMTSTIYDKELGSIVKLNYNLV